MKAIVRLILWYLLLPISLPVIYALELILSDDPAEFCWRDFFPSLEDMK